MPLRERKSTSFSIGWVRDVRGAGQLDLDPPYQRRSVWSRAYKQFFIDTILKNYPIPPIFVNMEVLEDGIIMYRVIDGRQRLLTVLDFLEDTFPISTDSYSTPNLRGKYFSELDTETQNRFYSYFLPFEIFSEAAEAEVTEIYDRFNRNVLRLNSQELRHAKWDGEFITLMEALADEPFWADLKMFGKVDVRRMKDVEHVSVMFSLTMHGIEDGDLLDDHYANYDEEIPDRDEHLERYSAMKRMITQLCDVVRQTRLSNRADFYSLWSALLEFAGKPDVIDYDKTAEKLNEFATRVSEVPSLDPAEADRDALQYSQAVRAGTTKQPNRERRKRILLNYIILG